MENIEFFYQGTDSFNKKYGSLSKMISHGTYGEVFKTKNNFAIKKSKSEDISFIINEIVILRYLNHPNIIELLSINENFKSVDIAMPLAEKTYDNKIRVLGGRGRTL